MKTIIELIQTLFKEIASIFTDKKALERIQKEFFYSIFYHWNAVTLLLKTKFKKGFFIAAAVLITTYILLELFLKPYKDEIVNVVVSWLNPIAVTTDKTVDATTQDSKGILGAILGLIALSFKSYYQTFFSKEYIEYIIFFEAYKFILITAAKPFLETLIFNIQTVYSDGKIIPRNKGLWQDYKHSFQLALYSLSLQAFLIVLLFPLAPVSTFLISGYFTGLMLMDGYTRSNGATAKESLQKIWSFKWFAIGIGFTFTALNFIPYIGPIFAPILSSVAAAIGLYELEKSPKSETSNELSDKDKAYFAAEKQAVEFTKDFDAAIDITNTFSFIKEKKIKTKNGTGLNLLIVFSIWTIILYLIFNYTATSSILTYLFPLFQPEFDSSTGIATTVSIFESMNHFFSVFTVLFLFGFTFYRFLIFLLHTSKINFNATIIQNAIEPGNFNNKINLPKLMINNLWLMVLEMIMMWGVLYIFLTSSAYSLLISLTVFYSIDIILVGSILLVSRESFNALSLAQKISILWQHKGCVLGTGLIYILSSFVPFAAMRYAPTLVIATLELAMQKIKLGQTIQYVRSLQKPLTQNG